MHPTTLDDYLTTFGESLARQAQESCAPLHVPGRDPILEPALLRPPFEAQAHVITGGIKALERQSAIQIAAEMGTGKGGLPSTKVLTPTGWSTLGEIKVGDEIIDPEGGTTTVTGKFERGVMPMYRVTFCDGASTVCSKDHLWMVHTPERRWRGMTGQVMTLDQILPKYLGKCVRKDGSRNRRYFIPLVEPAELNPQKLPIDPYLMGYLLGNACLSTGRSIFVTIPDPETAERLRPLIPNGIELKHRERFDYRISVDRGQVNTLLSDLRRLRLMRCRSETKFVPMAYMTGSVSQRTRLLQGLFDSDGCVAGKDGTGVEYSSASQRLAAQVVELVQSLGGVATTAIKENPAYRYKGERRTGQDSHRLYVTMPPEAKPFLLGRKADAYKPGTKYGPTRSIAKIEPIGDDECICIAVASKNKLYVTDDYIVTHNTLISQAIIQGHAQHYTPGGYRALVFCPPHLTHKWEREIRETVENAHVHHIESYRDLTAVCRHATPFGRGWWIVSNTRAKMGSKWTAVFDHGFLPPRAMHKIRQRVNQPNNYVRLRGEIYCPKCCEKIERYDKVADQWVEIKAEQLENKKHSCERCGEPLWQWNHDIDRWPVATYIHKKLHNWFQYLVIDESHQTKSADTAVGHAMGSLVAACQKTICLTGTLLGGYAWHVRPLLFRIAPASLIREGLGWHNPGAFDERYGRMERKVREVEKTGGSDNRQSRGKTSKTTKYVRPGVMPTLFGRHLIQNTIFLSLDEVSDNLPRLDEEVIGVEMDPELADAYREVEEAITRAIKDMLRKKDKRLLSRMLITLLGYPDMPWGWGEIGYYDYDEETHGKEWVHVVTPQELSPWVIRPKEKAIHELTKGHWQAGRQTWVYCTMTDARDVNERLRGLLSDSGLRTRILRSSVETGEREQWIADHAPKSDVIVSHPQLVETGLDLFDKRGSYNFSDLVFYSTGYNLFTLRQAARRSWRIGQTRPCSVKYLHYSGTMQARAMTLMGKKLAASASIEGKFSSEGLAALAGDEGSLEMALARSLVEKLDDLDVGRVWGKVGQKPAAELTTRPEPIAVKPAPQPELESDAWLVPPKKKKADRHLSFKQLSMF